MKTERIKGGIIHFVESKAKCPYCERPVAIEDIDEKFQKQSKAHTKHKCKGCKRFMGITQDLYCDYVSYGLDVKK